MCNTVIPGKYCDECGKILETFATYIEECVVITQDDEKKPGDCGEMNEMRVPADWGSCPGGCSSPVSEAVEPTPLTTPATAPETKPEISSREGIAEATSQASIRQKTESTNPSATSDEMETEWPPAAASSMSASTNVHDLLTTLIHAVAEVSIALHHVKDQMDPTRHGPDIGVNGRNKEGAGRVIIIETPTDIDNVVKLVLHRGYAKEEEGEGEGEE